MPFFTSTSVNKGAVKVAPKARLRRSGPPPGPPPGHHTHPRTTPAPSTEPSIVLDHAPNDILLTAARRHRASTAQSTGRLIAPGRRPSRIERDAPSLVRKPDYAPVFEEAEGPTPVAMHQHEAAPIVRRRSSVAAVGDERAHVRRLSATGRLSPVAERRRPSDAGRGRRKRSPSPAGEEVEFISGSVRMADLCKGSGRGRKSRNYGEFEKIKAKKKEEKRNGKPLQTQVAPTLQGDGHPAGTAQVRNVNGRLILDADSLTVDRSARKEGEAQPDEPMDINIFEHRVTSATYGKVTKKERWDDEATERFYNALSQWGTDFEMIAQMFPTRDRKQIKSKFVLEERRHPHLVTRALTRKKPVDMEEYAKQADKTFRPVEELEAELQALRDKYEEERQASIQEAEQRRQEMQATAQATPVPEKKKTRRVRPGEDGVELLGTIEEVEDAAKLATQEEDD